MAFNAALHQNNISLCSLFAVVDVTEVHRLRKCLERSFQCSSDGLYSDIIAWKQCNREHCSNLTWLQRRIKMLHPSKSMITYRAPATVVPLYATACSAAKTRPKSFDDTRTSGNETLENSSFL